MAVVLPRIQCRTQQFEFHSDRLLVGYEAKKTEHSGPKRGNGAYWGYKCEAKEESNRIRRENWKREIRDNTIGVMPEEAKDQPCASPASAIAPGPQATPPGDA